MGTTYTFSGSIDISPPLNYSEIKTATKVALGLVREHSKKYATESNVFLSYMPLSLAVSSFDKVTDEGVLRVTQALALEAPTRQHFLPFPMADLVRAMMKALPGHQWYGKVVALHEDGSCGHKLTVWDAGAQPTDDPVKVTEVKGQSYLVWDDATDNEPVMDLT